MSVRILLFTVIAALFLFHGCDDSGTTTPGDGTDATDTIGNGGTDDATEEPPPSFMEHPAKVLSVVDGDTLWVDYNGHDIKIRIRGIDCPEVAHPQDGQEAEPFAYEAMNFTTQRARPGSWVGLEFDKDLEWCADFVPDDPTYDACSTYGRLLAYIRTREDQDLGAQLLINGLATVYTAADFDRKPHYLELQAIAQEERRGIWSLQRWE